MIEIEVPGYRSFRLKNLVLDYNGTLARDGELLPEVADLLGHLSAMLEIHVVTADTFGEAAARLGKVPCRVVVLGPEDQLAAKRDYVCRVGSEETVSIGNGRNDTLMLQESALGIAVLQEEGAAVETVTAADVVAPGIQAALGLLSRPQRLIATLRS